MRSSTGRRSGATSPGSWMAGQRRTPRRTTGSRWRGTGARMRPFARARARRGRCPRLLVDLERPVWDLDEDPAGLDDDLVRRERHLGGRVERLARAEVGTREMERAGPRFRRLAVPGR